MTEIDLNDTPEGSDTESCSKSGSFQQEGVPFDTMKQDDVTRIFRSFFTADSLPPDAQVHLIYTKDCCCCNGGSN